MYSDYILFLKTVLFVLFFKKSADNLLFYIIFYNFVLQLKKSL